MIDQHLCMRDNQMQEQSGAGKECAEGCAAAA